MRLSKNILASLSRLLNSVLIWSLLVGGLFFCLYFVTMPRVNVGYGQSTEILTLAVSGGIFRPPGYPLYLSILRWWLALPHFNLSPVGMANLLSVIMTSVALSLTFAGLWSFFNLIPTSKKSASPIFHSNLSARLFMATLGTMMLGFSSLFWLYGQIGDVIAFSLLLVSFYLLLITLIMTYPIRRVVPLTLLLLTSGVLGIAISHQQLLIFLVPSFLYLLYLRRTKLSLYLIILTLSSGLISFILPYGLMWFFNPNALISWPFLPTLQGLQAFISQGDLSANSALRAFFSNGYMTNVSLEQAFNSIAHYLKIMIDTLGWWSAPLILFSLYQCWFKLQRIILVYLIAFAGLGLALSGYYQWPVDWGNQAQLVRLYAPSLILVPYLAYFGWWVALRRIGNFIKLLLPPKFIWGILFVPLGLIFSLQSLISFKQVNLSNFTLVDDRYRNILDSLSPKAILTCFTDTSCFSFLADQQINHRRLDVTVVPLAYPYVTTTIQNPDLHKLNYQSNPYLIKDIVSWNLGKRPIYAVEVSDYYNTALAFNFPNVFYIPLGYVGELTTKVPSTLPIVSETLTEKWIHTPTIFSDPTNLYQKSTPARDHLYNGLWYNRMGQRSLMLQEFNLAANLYYQFTSEDKKMFDGLRTKLEQTMSEARFQPGSSLPKSTTLLKEVKSYLDQKVNNRAYQTAMSAAFIDPTNPETHLVLGDVSEKIGDLKLAEIEYQNVLILDPHNTVAQARLLSISQNPLGLAASASATTPQN
jgi:hypothetical protein